MKKLWVCAVATLALSLFSGLAGASVGHSPYKTQESINRTPDVSPL